MAKKDKSAKAPTPDEVEAIFSDVDETGHTNASKARKERTRRRARKAAVEVDPLSGDDPSGSNVGKTMTRAAVVVLIVLLVAVVVSQVACGLVRRAGTAQLAEHVDAASVNTALRNGVEWGDGFTQFPEDYTVLEAQRKVRHHRGQRCGHLLQKRARVLGGISDPGCGPLGQRPAQPQHQPGHLPR